MLELEDFDKHLLSLEECGECILIGGQAVNFWAERYSGDNEELAKLMPYTSRDCDVYVSPQTWEQVKARYKSGGLVVGSSPAGGQLGILTLENSLKIDLLDRVYGLHHDLTKKLESRVKSFDHLHVCDPLLLFVGKCHSFINLPQGGRQDDKHIQMLRLILPHYFIENLEAVEQAAKESVAYGKAYKKEIKFFLSLENDRHVRAVCKELGVSLIDLLPLDHLCESGNATIQLYATKSLKCGTDKS